MTSAREAPVECRPDVFHPDFSPCRREPRAKHRVRGPAARRLRHRFRADLRAHVGYGAGGECLLAHGARHTVGLGPFLPLALAGLFFAADLGVWHFSILYTSVANSTVLANLAPIFVTLAGWVFFRHTVSRTFLAGMATAIAGMFILVGPNFGIGGTRLLGDALGALTAVFYAGYFLSIKSARDAGATTARLMAWSTTITTVVLLPIALASPQPFLPQAANGWLVLLGLALVSQILGQGLIAYAFAHLPASLSSVSLLIQPVMAALFAWVLFGEAVGTMQFVGGAVVLAGIWLARRGS